MNPVIKLIQDKGLGGPVRMQDGGGEIKASPLFRHQ